MRDNPIRTTTGSLHVRMRLRVGVLACFALILASAAGCGGGVDADASQVTCERFLRALHKGDMPAAYACLSTTCRAVTSQQQLEDMWKLLEKNRGEVKSWRIEDLLPHDDGVHPTVEIFYILDCAEYEGSVQCICVQEDGKWLIESFSFAT